MESDYTYTARDGTCKTNVKTTKMVSDVTDDATKTSEYNENEMEEVD